MFISISWSEEVSLTWTVEQVSLGHCLHCWRSLSTHSVTGTPMQISLGISEQLSTATGMHISPTTSRH